MKKRVTILLEINKKIYKFFSLFYSGQDASYYFHNHFVVENTPVSMAEPLHLLKTAGSFSTYFLKQKIHDGGNFVHVSIHPKRIYVKKRSDVEERHLMEEVEPQPFNKEGFRLHCVLTPAPPNLLPHYNNSNLRKDTEAIIFKWQSDYCPQVSIYELSKDFDVNKVDSILPPSEDLRVIASDGIHPGIVLHLRSTNGDPGSWASNCGIFGKLIRKVPISKSELQKIILYNDLNFDISSLPDDAIITDYKIGY